MDQVIAPKNNANKKGGHLRMQLDGLAG